MWEKRYDFELLTGYISQNHHINYNIGMKAYVEWIWQGVAVGIGPLDNLYKLVEDQ